MFRIVVTTLTVSCLCGGDGGGVCDGRASFALGHLGEHATGDAGVLYEPLGLGVVHAGGVLLLPLHVGVVVLAQALDRAVVEERAREGVDGAQLVAAAQSAQLFALLGRHEYGVEVVLELGPVVEKGQQVGVSALLVDYPRIARIEFLERHGDGVLELVLVLYVVLEQVLPALTRVAAQGRRRVVERVEAARDRVEEVEALLLEYARQADDLVLGRLQVGPRDYLRQVLGELLELGLYVLEYELLVAERVQKVAVDVRAAQNAARLEQLLDRVLDEDVRVRAVLVVVAAALLRLADWIVVGGERLVLLLLLL